MPPQSSVSTPVMIAVAIFAVLFVIAVILLGRKIVSSLVTKYLRTRYIAWVSLIAVTLCTALVIVVISVMGGWLRMFRQSFHGASGDIMVQATSMRGFPFYDDMAKEIEALPFVGPGNAVPVIKTFGLINLDNQHTDGVQVLGYPIDQIGHVNDFNKSLYRQHTERVEAADKLKDPNLKLTPDERAYYTLLANDHSPPSFAIAQDVGVPADSLPPGVEWPEPVKGRIFFLPSEHRLVFRGEMTDDQRAALEKLSDDPEYRANVRELYQLSDPQRIVSSKIKVDVHTWPGIILGEGVAHIRKDKNGQLVGRHPTFYRISPRLTVLGMPPGGGSVDVQNKAERPYWVVDDSRTKVYQIDSQTVYVPFDVLQKDMQMGEQSSEDSSFVYPARATDIDIRVKPGTSLEQARDQITKVCQSVFDRKLTEGKYAPVAGDFVVMTWEDSNRVWLHAIENEKVLVTFLFGMISVVAVFLIFCIFYMIVVEKTRDIGIIKSVGATSAHVAGIFLGYGLVIGLVGSGLGFLAGYLIVHNINELHAWLGRAMGIVIWDPQVYAFDSIPNTMNPAEVSVILAVAVLSAVLGALVPALRAASLNPVDSLRWE